MAATILFDGVEYRKIPEHDGYAVSRDGQLISCRVTGPGAGLGKWRRLLGSTNNDGYRQVSPCVSGVPAKKTVHALVLLTWVGPRPDGMECRHLNGNRIDNRVENLRWGSRAENLQDRETHGTVAVGESNGLAKLTESEVRVIRDLIRVKVAIAEIARLYGVGTTTVWNIAHGRTWSHVK